MITAYAAFPRPVESPEEGKKSVEAMMESSGVTGFNVFLTGADVEAYRYRIEAENTPNNLTKITEMFGTINTNQDSGRVSPAKNARDVKKLWRVAGQEGRFAKENPPPPGAK